MNKNEYLSSVPPQAESFALTELFNNTDNSILYIAKDDREIFNIKEKITWLLTETKILIYRSWDQIPYLNKITKKLYLLLSMLLFKKR